MNHRPAAGSRTAGFTLIEMLAVAAIVAILLTIGLGAVEMLIPDSRLVAAAREIASFIEDARDEAVISGRTVRIELQFGDSPDAPQAYRSILDPEPGREDKAEEEEFLLTVSDWKAVPEGIRFETLQMGVDDVIDRGEYDIPIYSDGTLRGHILTLYCAEIDTYASIQVSGLLGTAQFSLGQVDFQEVTEDTF